MSTMMRFVGGPADGDVIDRDDCNSHVLPRPDDGEDGVVAYYERAGRDEDGTWVMEWRTDGS